MNEEYADYLQSEHWYRLRRVAFARDGFRCRICGSGEQLEGHHWSYDDLNNVDNVITLCHRCHRDVHEFWDEVRQIQRDPDGPLRKAETAYTEAVAQILDKYVVRREKTLSDTGDTTFLTEGRHGLMNKYIHFMINGHPYYDQSTLEPHLGYVGAMRYQNMRLARKKIVRKRAERSSR